MDSIVLNGTVGSDGVLALKVSLGPSEAGRDVKITVEPITPLSGQATWDKEEWQRFVAETAGAWQGELERPDQGAFEKRESWP